MERIESYADPDRDMKRYYRASWQAMLQVLLDWPGSDAARWASYELDRVGERLQLSLDGPVPRRQIGEFSSDAEKEWLHEVLQRWKESP